MTAEYLAIAPPGNRRSKMSMKTKKVRPWIEGAGVMRTTISEILKTDEARRQMKALKLYIANTKVQL